MEEFVHRQNLERYRKMLSEKTHELHRQIILRLLADEENRDDPLRKVDHVLAITSEPSISLSRAVSRLVALTIVSS